MKWLRVFSASLIIALAGIVIQVLVTPAPVAAQTQGVCTEDENPSFLSFPTWYKYLDRQVAPDGSCDITLANNTDGTAIFSVAGKILLAVFEIVLRIGGIVAIGMVVYGGILYVLSQGEPDRTKNAKNTIVNALIGLVIAMSSVAIVNIIARNIV